MSTTPRPAWREPMVWLVAGGPIVVVLASFATLALAILNPDPPLDLQARAQAADVRTEPVDTTPAMVARNHAATGVAPRRDPK